MLLQAGGIGTNAVTDKATQIMDKMLLNYLVGRPNLREFFLAFVSEMDYLLEQTNEVYLGRFLENAVGEQLDVIGAILNQNRRIVLPVINFGFQEADGAIAGMADESAPAIGGTFSDGDYEGGGEAPLTDSAYRRLLLVRASCMNKETSSINQFYYYLQTLFGRAPSYMKLEQGQVTSTGKYFELSDARYLRENKGITDRMVIPALTLNNDFSGSFEFITKVDNTTFLSGLSNNVSTIVVDLNPSQIRFFAYNSDSVLQTLISFDGVFWDNKLHKVEFSLVGTTASLSVDGATPLSSQWASYDTASIDNLLRRGGSVNTRSLVLLDLKIHDNGTLVRDYPLDEPRGTDIVYDKASGEHGLVINGLDSDKDVYELGSEGEYVVVEDYIDYRGNEGTTDTAIASSFAHSGADGVILDFYVEDLDVAGNNGDTFISMVYSGGSDFLSVSNDLGNWKISTNGRTAGNGSPILANQLNNVKLILEGPYLVLVINGIEDYRVVVGGGTAWLENSSIDLKLYHKDVITRAHCILSDLEIYDDETLIRRYALDDYSDILANSMAELGDELYDFSNVGTQEGVSITQTNSGFSVIASTDNLDRSYVNLSTITGKEYKVTLGKEITAGGSSLTLFIRSGSDGNGNIIASSNDTEVALVFTAQSSFSTLLFDIGTSTAPAEYEVSNISVKQADGYGQVVNGNYSDWRVSKKTPYYPVSPLATRVIVLSLKGAEMANEEVSFANYAAKYFVPAGTSFTIQLI